MTVNGLLIKYVRNVCIPSHVCILSKHGKLLSPNMLNICEQSDRAVFLPREAIVSNQHFRNRNHTKAFKEVL